MAWTERQHALLHALGLRLWAPAAEPTPPAAPPPTPPQAWASVGAAPLTAAQGSAEHAAGATARRPTASRSAPPSAAGLAVSAPAPLPSTDNEPPAQPRVSGMDWSTLRETVAGCRACTLCESRTQTVFGVGHPQAHWLVVGEAPGEQEDLSGEPFVGAAGQLLDRMLAALQLTRSTEGAQPPAQRVYIANTLKCRPPRNRNPTPAELAQCEPYLQAQIELLQPRLILAMGRFAVQSLLRSSEPIGRLRGRVHQYCGVPLIVTYHPAYLLRNLLDKARAWEDLCLAAGVAEARETLPAPTPPGA